MANVDIPLEKGRYHDPIGPASMHTIRLQSFLDSVVEKQGLWKRYLPSAQAEFNGWNSDQKTNIASRCDVQDLARELQQDLSDEGQLEDLKSWHYTRLHAGSDDKDRLDNSLVQTKPQNTIKRRNQPASRTTTPANTSQREASTSKVLLDPDEDDDLALYRVDSALVFSEIALQREKLLHNDIQSLKAFRDSCYYFRKSRQSDAQSLEYLKTNLPLKVYHTKKDIKQLEEAFTVKATGYNEPHVLVSVTSHPTNTRIAAPTNSERISILSRLQKMKFLGDHTLADIRDTIVSPAMSIPIEASNEEAENVMDYDQDIEGHNPRPRYTRKPWRSEAIMIIDNQVYADTRYTSESESAKLLMSFVEGQTHASTHSAHRPSATVANEQHQLSEDDELRLLQEDNADEMPSADEDDNDIQTGFGAPIEADSQSLGSEELEGPGPGTSSASRAVNKTAPSYQLSDKAMQDVRLSDLTEGIRLRKPCLLLQQGLSEHIFEFEEIRMLHPTDPAPLYQGYPVYPLSTYLSRLPMTKCFICEKDPATRITLHDELAGVSPCYLCDICFQCFHEDEESAIEKGVDIIPILDEFMPNGKQEGIFETDEEDP